MPIKFDLRWRAHRCTRRETDRPPHHRSRTHPRAARAHSASARHQIGGSYPAHLGCGGPSRKIPLAPIFFFGFAVPATRFALGHSLSLQIELRPIEALIPFARNARTPMLKSHRSWRASWSSDGPIRSWSTARTASSPATADCSL